MSSGNQRLIYKKKNINLRCIIAGIIAAVMVIIAVIFTGGRIDTKVLAGSQTNAIHQSTTVLTDNTGEDKEDSVSDESEARFVTFRWIGNIVGILCTAIITSGGIYIYYRNKLGRIEPLPIFINEEELQ